MEKSPSVRHNLRLKGYDYAQAGAYFVTIVTHNRLCLFGEVANGEMMLNPAGLMVAQVCQEIPLHIAGMEMDIFQIMPNHFHGIIILTGSVDIDRITSSVGATIPSKSVGAGRITSSVGATLREAHSVLWLPRADTEVCPYNTRPIITKYYATV